MDRKLFRFVVVFAAWGCGWAAAQYTIDHTQAKPDIYLIEFADEAPLTAVVCTNETHVRCLTKGYINMLGVEAAKAR